MLAPGIYADAVVGAIVILVIAAGSFAVIRSRAARTEEALRTETERRYQAIVEQQPAITYTWDPSIGAGGAATLYIGPQIERLLGYTPEEWLADPISGYDASTPTTATAWSRRRSDADREGVAFREEYRSCAKDGRVRLAPGRVGARRARRGWPADPDAGRDLRRHGPEGGGGPAPGSREPVPHDRRTRARGRLRVGRGRRPGRRHPPRTSARRSNDCSASPPRRGSRTRPSGRGGCTPKTSPASSTAWAAAVAAGAPVHGRVPDPARRRTGAAGSATRPSRVAIGERGAPRLPGRDDRRDGPAGGPAEAPRGRGAVPASRRADPGDHVQRRPGDESAPATSARRSRRCSGSRRRSG